jgi:hypothetical protein
MLVAYQVEGIHNIPAPDGFFYTAGQHLLAVRPDKISEKFAKPNHEKDLETRMQLTS